VADDDNHSEEQPAEQTGGRAESAGEFRYSEDLGDTGATFLDGLTFRSKPVQYVILDGNAVVEGDINLGPVDEVHDLTEMRRAELDGGAVAAVSWSPARSSAGLTARFRTRTTATCPTRCGHRRHRALGGPHPVPLRAPDAAERGPAPRLRRVRSGPGVLIVRRQARLPADRAPRRRLLNGQRPGHDGRKATARAGSTAQIRLGPG